MVYTWLNNIQFALLPGQCVLCRAPSKRQRDLCLPCEEQLCSPWCRCQHCGLPTSIDASSCGQCAKRGFPFQYCIPLSLYRAPINQLITAIKYQRDLAAAAVLGQLLAQQLRYFYRDEPMPDVLIPVPLHWRRQWRRGFNQAHHLAAILGGQLALPVQGNCVIRARATPSQQGMNRQQRKRNLRRAFTIPRAPKGSHVALVDDVVTTGTTASLISALLLEHGATRVDVWCLARTPLA